MAVEMKQLAWKLDNLFMLRRTLLTKTTLNTGLYFGQLPVLAYISNHEGCTQKEIADWMKVSPASIALSTKRLQKAGFIEKKVDQLNLRRNMLSITPKGNETAIQCREGMIKFDENMFECLSEEEAESLMNIVDKLLDSLTGGEGFDVDFVPMMEMDDRIQQRLENPDEERQDVEE